MAVSLALLTGAVWTVLAIIGLLAQRGRREPRWDLWDMLRGVRAVGGLFVVSDWRRSSRLLGDGYHLGVRAHSRGDVRTATSLTRAELASTRSVVEQIDAVLAQHVEQIVVLQAAAAVQPLSTSQLHWTALRALARLDACASRWLGPLARLHLRLYVLRVAVWLLVWRIRALRQLACARTLESLPAIHADVASLSRAATVSRRTLQRSWRASRSLVADAGRRAKHPPM